MRSVAGHGRIVSAGAVARCFGADQRQRAAHFESGGAGRAGRACGGHRRRGSDRPGASSFRPIGGDEAEIAHIIASHRKGIGRHGGARRNVDVASIRPDASGGNGNGSARADGELAETERGVASVCQHMGAIASATTVSAAVEVWPDAAQALVAG